jgi:hypothetical protein
MRRCLLSRRQLCDGWATEKEAVYYDQYLVVQRDAGAISKGNCASCQVIKQYLARLALTSTTVHSTQVSAYTILILSCVSPLAPHCTALGSLL